MRNIEDEYEKNIWWFLKRSIYRGRLCTNFSFGSGCYKIPENGQSFQEISIGYSRFEKDAKFQEIWDTLKNDVCHEVLQIFGIPVLFDYLSVDRRDSSIFLKSFLRGKILIHMLYMYSCS